MTYSHPPGSPPEERSSTADGREKFGTYFRDPGGGDYADQRYYSSGSGRFNVPDPGGMAAASPGDPGTWNRYAYAYADPINNRDKHGLWASMSDDGDIDINDDGCDDGTMRFVLGTVGPCFWATIGVGVPAGLAGEESTPDISCDISVATKNGPRDWQDVTKLFNGPSTNDLGQYQRPDGGWGFAVQIQANLFGDTNGQDWIPTQTWVTKGTVRVRQGAPAQPVNLKGSDNLVTSSLLPGYAPAIIYEGQGTYDWIDAPGFSGSTYAANLTYTFTSTLANRVTGDKCSTTWTLRVRGAGQKWA